MKPFFKNSTLTLTGAKQVQTSKWLNSGETLIGEVESWELTHQLLTTVRKLSGSLFVHYRMTELELYVHIYFAPSWTKVLIHTFLFRSACHHTDSKLNEWIIEMGMDDRHVPFRIENKGHYLEFLWIIIISVLFRMLKWWVSASMKRK